MKVDGRVEIQAAAGFKHAVNFRQATSVIGGITPRNGPLAPMLQGLNAKYPIEDPGRKRKVGGLAMSATPQSRRARAGLLRIDAAPTPAPATNQIAREGEPAEPDFQNFLAGQHVMKMRFDGCDDALA